MSLVSKNKITEYINEHPEARIILLTWLKEYPYSRHMFLDGKGQPVQGCGSGNAQPDIGDYSIRFRINYSAKAVCITWVGTKQEHEEKIEHEFKELQRKNPNLTRSVKVIDVVVETPDSACFEQSKESMQSETNPLNTTFFSTAHIHLGNDLSKEQSFETEASYQKGLLRLNDIFDAQSNTPDFDELLLLLRLVSNYEEYNLKFPTLQLFEVVLRRMKIFNMTALNITQMLGSEAGIHQFLSGKQTLPPKILTRLFKLLGIRFPVDDPYFL